MTTLISYGNTYNPCLQILRSKGYQLWSEESDRTVNYFANREENTFMATSPPELLGVVCLWEIRGHKWNTQEPDIISELAQQRP